MKTVLVGAVGSTEVALNTMITTGNAPEALVTLPLELAHRHSDFVDLRQIASSAGVPVVEVGNVNSEASLAELRAIAPDVIYVIGWSQLCGLDFLAIPTVGAVGFHPSNLPTNRGRAVIPWTILQGIRQTGSTLFWLGAGMDDGDVIAQETFVVAEDETAQSLMGKHASALADMLADTLMHTTAESIPARQQNHASASYCAKRTADDGAIDWREGAKGVWTLIRAAGRPYPGAFTYLGGNRVTIWRASYLGPRPIWAQPGQVVESSEAGLVVQCGDCEHILLEEIETTPQRDARIVVGARFRASSDGGSA